MLYLNMSLFFSKQNVSSFHDIVSQGFGVFVVVDFGDCRLLHLKNLVSEPPEPPELRQQFLGLRNEALEGSLVLGALGIVNGFL